MSKLKIEEPEDDFGKWLFRTVTGQEGSVEVEIPGTEMLSGTQDRFDALFNLYSLLEEMNENMANINAGIDELNENIKNLGLGGLGSDSDE